MLALTKRGIFLGPSNNIQGGLKCLWLNGIYVVIWRKFTKLLIPGKIIQKVSGIISARGKPKNLTSRNQNGNNTEPKIIHHGCYTDLSGLDGE